MKLLLSTTLVTIYGLSIRLLYNLFPTTGVMTLSFFFVLPFVIGYLTMLILPYREGQSSSGAFLKPWIPCVLILVITDVTGMEGIICWVMASPLIFLMAGLGGLIAFNRKKKKAMREAKWDFEKEDWDRPGSLKVSLLLILPLLLGSIEGDRTTAFKALSIEKQIEIDAPPSAVWAAVTGNQTHAITSHAGISHLLGFPHHLNTRMGPAIVGGSRVATYEKGLVFNETINTVIPDSLLALSIQTDPSKISAAIMDEHIVIGGKHIKMQEDEYRIQPLPNGKTLLSLTSRFSINTPFNWYAGLWSEWLMSDVLNEELGSIVEQVKS